MFNNTLTYYPWSHPLIDFDSVLCPKIISNFTKLFAFKTTIRLVGGVIPVPFFYTEKEYSEIQSGGTGRDEL